MAELSLRKAHPVSEVGSISLTVIGVPACTVRFS
jgi:hypothetical protein